MALILERLLLAMLLMQALLMFFDEFYYHRRRGLETFERWSHLSDTGLYLAALTLPILVAPTDLAVGIYAFFALASSLLVTKDEWVHARHCSGGELWCHSLLFILHGGILVTVGILWNLDPSSQILRALPVPIGIWGIYQFFYWVVYDDQRRDKERRQQSVLR